MCSHLSMAPSANSYGDISVDQSSKLNEHLDSAIKFDTFICKILTCTKSDM